MKACPMRPACTLSFYLGRLVAAPSRLDSRRVHSPRTCGINKDNAVWNNNSQFCPIEAADNTQVPQNTKENKMKG